MILQKYYFKYIYRDFGKDNVVYDIGVVENLVVFKICWEDECMMYLVFKMVCVLWEEYFLVYQGLRIVFNSVSDY